MFFNQPNNVHVIVLIYLTLTNVINAIDPPFDWKSFHEFFYVYPDEALMCDTELVIRAVSETYIAHIQPPVKDSAIIGLKLEDLIRGRIKDPVSYMESIEKSLSSGGKTTISASDTQGNQYVMVTTPLRNRLGETYGLRHAIKSFVKHDPSEYLTILRDTSDTDMWKLLVNSIPEFAIFAVSTEFKIQTWTETCRLMYGYDETEINDLPYSLLAQESPTLIIQSRVITQRQHLRKDGSVFIAEEQISPIFSHDLLVGHSVIVRDLTDGKKAERLLLQAREESHIMQRNFLSTVSHESRSNTAIIISSIENVLDTNLSIEQRDHCEDVHKASQMLLQVVDDILDYSSFCKHGIQLKNVVFDLRKAAHIVVKLQKRSLVSKASPAFQDQVDLQIHIDDAVPETVVGDEIRFSQILTNLIGNAIKFTEKGIIRLHIQKCENVHESMDCISICVEDDGVGIVKDQQQYLFDAFYQADAGMSRSKTGTGLGLANTKMIVEAMNGFIEVVSEIGQGSRFYCQIHLYHFDPLTPRPKITLRTYSIPDQFHRTRILLVEDNLVLAKIAMKAFNKLGFPDGQVVWVDNGSDAVTETRDGAFDIIFMDLMLPIMDGIEATRQIRKFNAQVPIIALTSNALEEDRRLCAEAGVSKHMSKPVALKDLKDTIMKYIDI
jgi:osomolarity two-component system sensor histidine kinase TcsA